MCTLSPVYTTKEKFEITGVRKFINHMTIVTSSPVSNSFVFKMFFVHTERPKTKASVLNSLRLGKQFFLD